jgi:hypothetical protein
MFNWREWSGRNAELAWLRQEKKRKELCRNPAQNNTHLPTTSSTSYLTTGNINGINHRRTYAT